MVVGVDEVVVNLAARIESLTKRYEQPILISEETWNAAVSPAGTKPPSVTSTRVMVSRRAVGEPPVQAARPSMALPKPAP